MDFDDSSSSDDPKQETAVENRPRAAKTSGFAIDGEFGPPRTRNSDEAESFSDEEDPLESPEHCLFTADGIATRAAEAKDAGDASTPRSCGAEEPTVEDLLATGRIISSGVHTSVVVATTGSNAVCVKIMAVPQAETDVLEDMMLGTFLYMFGGYYYPVKLGFFAWLQVSGSVWFFQNVVQKIVKVSKRAASAGGNAGAGRSPTLQHLQAQK